MSKNDDFMTKHNTTPAASASRHTPEPWSMEAGSHRILFRGRIPFYSERVLLVKAGNALAGMNPEAVKSCLEKLQYACDYPLAMAQNSGFRQEVHAALKGSK